MKILVALLLSIGIPAGFVILSNNNKILPQENVQKSFAHVTYEEEHLTRCFFWIPEDEATAKALGFTDQELGRE